MDNPAVFSPPKGVSLPEISVALALVSLLLGMAVPELVDLVRDTRLVSGGNSLIADLHLARSTAIQRNRSVVLCRSEDQQTCARSPRARADWSMGWIVFVNRDGDDRRDPGEPLLRVSRGVGPGVSLFFNQWWRVSYHPNGRAKNGTFTLCDARGPEAARAVILYLTGRPRTARQSSRGGLLDCRDA